MPQASSWTKGQRVDATQALLLFGSRAENKKNGDFGYAANVSVNEVIRSLMALIRSEYALIFDLSDLAMSSK